MPHQTFSPSLSLQHVLFTYQFIKKIYIRYAYTKEPCNLLLQFNACKQSATIVLACRTVACSQTPGGVIGAAAPMIFPAVLTRLQI